MPKPRPSPLGATLRFFRFACGWSEEELARARRVKPMRPSLISAYERGKERGGKELSREQLDELLDLMDVPPEAADTSLSALEIALLPESPGSPVDPTPAQLRTIRKAMAVASQQAARAVWNTLAGNVRREHAARARRKAGKLWQTLRALPPGHRRAAVEKEKKYWTWAVAERLCAESVRAAAHRAEDAMALAKLALRVAELAPGTEPWHSRLQGYVWAFIANARRVQGDLPGAEEGFLHSDKLWEAGALADPGVLDGSRLLDLKASLRTYQGRLDEALKFLNEALRVTGSQVGQGRLLIQKATTLELMGENEQAITALRQAERRLEGTRDQRLPWLVRFTLVSNLRQLRRFTEAEALLPEVRELAIELGNELDLVRALWLEAGVAAGLGRQEQALAALHQVRRYFTENRIPYDAALASLEVAVLYLEQERPAEVKELAVEMLWIFKDQEVHQEALAALRLFYEAAKNAEATAELAQRVADYLVKARHHPELRFDADGCLSAEEL